MRHPHPSPNPNLALALTLALALALAQAQALPSHLTQVRRPGCHNSLPAGGVACHLHEASPSP